MNEAAADPSPLLRNLATFGRVLRSSGLEVGPRRLQTAVRALDAMGLGSREDVYWILYCAFVSRREEAAAFDLAFTAFWDRLLPDREGDHGATELLDDEDEPASEDEDGNSRILPVADATAGSVDDAEGLDDPDRGDAWSRQERLRQADFSVYGRRELREARKVMQRIHRSAPVRRSRRFRAARAGREIDRRRTLRSAMRTEGHPVARRWREHRLVPRRMVFLVDVSGSMQAYAPALLLFAQVVVRAAPKVEVFSFGTRLTRITGHLAQRDSAAALSRAGEAIPDWAGGTRIGDNLKAFNDTAGRRGTTRGAVVVVFSDGSERSDPGLLGEQMARIHRAAHSVVWVNPLAGDPRYEPRTRGMVAALPYIDVLLAGHNLAALEALVAVLDAIPERRSRRARSTHLTASNHQAR